MVGAARGERDPGVDRRGARVVLDVHLIGGVDVDDGVVVEHRVARLHPWIRADGVRRDEVGNALMRGVVDEESEALLVRAAVPRDRKIDVKLNDGVAGGGEGDGVLGVASRKQAKVDVSR